MSAILFTLSMLPSASGPACAAAAAVRILAFGDSLTEGYGVPAGMEFPAQLERALTARGLSVRVINAGVSGDTTAGGLARLDWSLPDIAQGPAAAIVELGANDGLRGLPPAEMERNLDQILARLKARNVPILVAGMKAPRNYGMAYAADYDAVFPRLAKKYGALFYPFFLEGVALDPKLVQPDGLHPNAAGVAVIVKAMAPLVAQLVEQAQMRAGERAPARRP